MNLQAEINQVNATLKIELTKEELAPYLEAALNNKIANIEVDGFRKGKMPKAMFLQKYSIAAVLGSTNCTLINTLLLKFVCMISYVWQ